MMEMNESKSKGVADEGRRRSKRGKLVNSRMGKNSLVGEDKESEAKIKRM